MGLAKGLTVRFVVLGVLLFAGGVLTGMHLAEGRAEARIATALSGLEAAQERYVRRFVRDFGLDAKQERTLRLVLEERARKQKDWWNDRLLRDDPRDRAALVRLDRTSEGLIRLLLRNEQRAKYDAMIVKTRAREAPASRTGMR